ncbi:SPG7 matrix AAA peptidase subunit, paraplegin, partial [Homo sapiens]
EARLLVAKAYRHTEKVLQDNLDKLQAVWAVPSPAEAGLPVDPCSSRLTKQLCRARAHHSGSHNGSKAAAGKRPSGKGSDKL